MDVAQHLPSIEQALTFLASWTAISFPLGILTGRFMAVGSQYDHDFRFERNALLLEHHVPIAKIAMTMQIPTVPALSMVRSDMPA